jgi:Mn-dependent DtxR family transcriptional regulator/predicted transcriptional regulator
VPIKARNIALTRAQAACLIALRHGKNSKSKVALEAELDLIQTATALVALGQLGLARQNKASRTWRATARGKGCRYKTLPDRPRRAAPGASGLRLLALLDRPMRGREIAEKLRITHQRVLQLVIRLHARGYVSIGDQENILWMVMRAGDKTRLLSRDQERVLSAIPREYVTDAKQIRLAARLPADTVEKILEGLITAKLVEASAGPRGDQVYRLTSAGLSHPQRTRSARQAQELRLPVESERVRNVLSAIADAGVLRATDMAKLLQIPRPSLNALMQYFKRKHLVQKVGRDLHAPYSLTEMGHATLAEMTRRQAA